MVRYQTSLRVRSLLTQIYKIPSENVGAPPSPKIIETRKHQIFGDCQNVTEFLSVATSVVVLYQLLLLLLRQTTTS